MPGLTHSSRGRWNGKWHRTDRSALDDETQQKHDGLPEITISAYDGTCRTESVPVLKQRTYTGRILPSAIANTPCADLGVDGMLENLNVPVCTPDSHLYKVCTDFVTENCDLGTAYAHLRPHLYDFDTVKHTSYITKAPEDDKMRRNMFIDKNILDGDVPPRRIWDLHANRVVPWWAARKCPWPISHAWVNDKDLKREMTPINGYEWPVPIPKDTDLHLIRIEMLNLGAEYIWLDVLCLRQKGQGEDPRGNTSKEEWERRETLRREEWKVDLPTIGWVYHKAEKVVYYFSGLGLPLSFKPGDFENDRCWFNRGWTLQETRDNLLIAGETHHHARYMTKKGRKGFKFRNWFSRLWRSRKISDDEFMTGHMRKLFDKKLASLRQMQREESIFHILSQMQKRKSTNPVDKVAGLVYLFYSQYIPAYNADQSEEDAWTELVSMAQDWFRADLFFLYPEPGNGKKFWHPSWEQVMTEVLPQSSLNKVLYNIKINRTKKGGDKYLGLRIDSCRVRVRGLADEPSPEMPRCGKLDITSHLGRKHTFDVVANHAYPIPDGKYTLIGTAKHSSTMEGVIWVVGKEYGVRKKKFRKVSVLRMANKREEDKLWKLDVHRYTKTPLL